jgi:hypothetical protein
VCVAVLAPVLTAGISEAAASGVPPHPAGIGHLDVRDGEVTGAFVDADPTEVVTAIADAVHASVTGAATGPAVTAAFEHEPLVRALERLLAAQSFTVVYGPDGDVRRIRLAGGAAGRPSDHREDGGGRELAATPVSAAVETIEFPPALLDRDIDVPQDAGLRDLGQRSPLRDVLRRVRQEDDPASRRAGARLVVTTIDADAGGRAWLRGTIDGIAATPASDAVRLAPETRAVLEAVVETSGDVDLRRRAQTAIARDAALD